MSDLAVEMLKRRNKQLEKTVKLILARVEQEDEELKEELEDIYDDCMFE